MCFINIWNKENDLVIVLSLNMQIVFSIQQAKLQKSIRGCLTFRISDRYRSDSQQRQMLYSASCLAWEATPIRHTSAHIGAVVGPGGSTVEVGSVRAVCKSKITCSLRLPEHSRSRRPRFLCFKLLSFVQE